jgi:glycosyltransferase involved in cell wall biosynthesis
MGRFESYKFKKGIFKRLLKEVGAPDIIHLHILAADQLLFARYALRRKIPYFISEHWSGYVTEGFKNLPIYKQLLYKRMSKRAKGILPVSEFLKSGMQDSGLNGTFHVVPNVVSLPEKPQEKNKAFTFIVVADMVDSIKNISGIIQAFQNLNDSKAQLLLVGDGPDMERIKAVANKKNHNITFKGRLSNKEALLEMSKAHCLIVNSYVETFSVVILEARAQGLQVISTDCGGPKEIADSYTQIIPLNKSFVLEEKMHFALKQTNILMRDISDFELSNIGLKIQSLYNV